MHKEDKNNSIDDIEGIWEKWFPLVPPSIIESSCLNAMEPLGNQISKLIDRNVQVGFFSQKDASFLYQKTGELLAQIAEITFMLGLEYGVRDKYQPRTDAFVSENTKEALPLINIATEPANKFIVRLVGGLAASKIPKDICFSIAQDSGEILLYCSVQCFRLGLNYSTWV